MATLFGSEDPKVKTFSTLSPSQQAAMSNLMPLLMAGAQGIPSEIFPGFPTFTEEPPGLTRGQQLSLLGLENIAAGTEGAGVGSRELLAGGREALAGFFEPEMDVGAFDEFFRKAIEDPTLKAWRERALPTITRQHAGGSFWGSQRAEAERRGMEDIGAQLSAQRATLAFATEEATKNRALEALGLAPAMAGADIDMLMKTLLAAGTERGVEKEQYGARREEFYRMLNEASRRLGMAGQFATTPTVGGIGLPGVEGAEGDIIQALIMLAPLMAL